MAIKNKYSIAQAWKMLSWEKRVLLLENLAIAPPSDGLPNWSNNGWANYDWNYLVRNAFDKSDIKRLRSIVHLVVNNQMCKQR
jgi:hypothetical protein